MTDQEARKQAAQAQLEEMRRVLGTKVPGKRQMAGMALAGFLAPPVLSMMDNQETTLLGNLGGGMILGGGMTLGGIIGNESALAAANNNQRMQDALATVKAEAAKISNEQGVAAGQAHYAQAKNAYVDDVRNPAYSKMGLNASPMQYRRAGRGVALGALAAALPAYLAMRNGEIV